MDSNIIERLERIETKLDAVIKAMHDYDDNIYSGYDEPNEALLKAAGLYNEEINKKYGESSFEAFMDAKMEDDMGASNIQPKQKRYYKNKRSKRNENKK